jgi:hypothetical protein
MAQFLNATAQAVNAEGKRTLVMVLVVGEIGIADATTRNADGSGITTAALESV